ncbi:MAG: hypothetical protein V3W34_07855 [Phycisphaerae bacterium]
MDRDTFRKHLISFADGTTEPELFDEARQHVEQCPESAADVEDIRRFKRSLARIYAQEQVSPELRQRVRAAIGAAARPPAPRILRLRRWTVPLGIAAAVAFVWVASQFVPRSDGQRGAPSAAPVQARYVGAVRQRHNRCTKMGPTHHRQSLSRDLGMISAVLGRELGFQVAAPDLTKKGFELQSADNCGFAGIPAAHLVYHRPSDGLNISLFSTRRLNDLAAQEFKRGRRNYFVAQNVRAATVLAWHVGDTTCVLCGKMGLDGLMALADAIE